MSDDRTKSGGRKAVGGGDGGAGTGAGAARSATVARLAPALAHDIGNALGAMRLRLQVLAREVGTAAAAGHVEAIRRVLDDAHVTMEPLRWLATPEPQGAQLASVAEAVAAGSRLVRGALRVSTDAAARARGLAVEIDASVGGAPRVLAGAHTLTGVLADLFMVAAFTPRDGDGSCSPVRVTASRQGDELTLALGLGATASTLAVAVDEANARLKPFGGRVDVEAGESDATVCLRLQVATIAG